MTVFSGNVTLTVAGHCRAFIGKKILIKLFVMINSMMLMYNSAWML